MKIVHIAANAPYNDYWGYHENILPHYHKKLGHEVTIITTNTMHKDGQIVKVDCDDYVLNDEVRVIRLEKEKYFLNVITKLRSKLNVYELLLDIKPDFIFFHGVLSSSIFECIKYKKKINKKCSIACDNHLDYYNGSKSKGIKGFLVSNYYRLKIKFSQRYVTKYYGVTPWRCKYLEEYFNVPKEKIELLVMGGDDRYISYKNQDAIKEEIRKKLNISKDDFVIVSGGKIDKTKNIHLLMKAVSEIENNNIKLVLFGQVLENVKEEFENLSNYQNIKYIGWIKAEEVYNYFLASDLVAFPGTHSVLWEQACACGIPGIFKDWEGMHHVDVGGNCVFLRRDSVDEIKNTILDIYDDKEKYSYMRKIAQEKGIKTFSYAEIARRAIELNNE